MLEERLLMSTKELDRLEVIKKVLERRLSQVAAAKLLGLSTRQLRRLTRRFEALGAKGLVSRKRGSCGRKKVSKSLVNQAIDIIQRDFYDYGPTLAAEKLLEYHDIALSKETVRQLMIQSGLWKAKHKKASKPHPRRERRAHFGELIQIDGSVHHWFEERGPRCTLLVFVDDATSMILELKLVEAETTLGYFSALKSYLKSYGKPTAIYSDKHGVFKVNAKSSNPNRDGLTQFGRALDELGIQAIFAHSPQAKGRVERANATLQDRLIKALRYQNIATIEEGNQFLEDFRTDYNQRFAKLPQQPVDVHRHLSRQERQGLDITCSIQTKRKLSKDRTLRYKDTLYNIKLPGKGKSLCQASVIVCENGSDKITILYRNQPLPYTVYKENCAYGQILTQKELQSYLNQKAQSWVPVSQNISELPQ